MLEIKRKHPSSLNQLLKLLEDGQWHSSNELVSKVSFRFAHSIFQARKQGLEIETRRETNNQFEYRLVSPAQTVQQIEQKNLESSTIEQIIPNLKLLVLFGSRARGDHRLDSDWDFAVLYDEQYSEMAKQGYLFFEVYELLADFFQIPSDRIDIVNLNSSSELIAHYVARDGKILYEQEHGLFEQFCKEHLMNEAQLEQFRQNLRNQIDLFLKEQKDE
jgi:predicted nucleotidyltransferase